MLEGEGGWGGETSRRAVPEGCSPLIAEGARIADAAPGQRHSRSAKPQRIRGGKIPARVWKMELRALSQPLRFPFSPGFAVSPAWGGSLVIEEFPGPADLEAPARAEYLPLPEQPGQGDRGFLPHSGGLNGSSSAGRGQTAAELQGTLHRLVDNGEAFRGLTSCSHERLWHQGQECSQDLHGASSSPSDPHTGDAGTKVLSFESS